MSKLLLNDQPLLIMPQLATVIGLNESIVLQQIHYWLEINRKADKNYFDDYYWTFNTYEEWKKQFPFWSERTIQRIILNLQKLKLVLVGHYNKKKYDRTKWYRIDYNALENLENKPIGQVGTMDNDKLAQPIPETNAKTNIKYIKHKQNNIPQTGLHKIGNKHFYFGKKITKKEYQFRCTENLVRVMEGVK